MPLPPRKLTCYNESHAPVAQLDRAIASGAIGREFESLRARQVPLLPHSVAAIQDLPAIQPISSCAQNCAHSGEKEQQAPHPRVNVAAGNRY
jgi:hypothetical protein